MGEWGKWLRSRKLPKQEPSLAPKYLYPDGSEETKVLQPDYKKYRTGERSKNIWEQKEYISYTEPYTFYTKDGDPTLPLKKNGKIWFTGWDIPVEWVLDSGGQVWKGSDHGGALCKCTAEELVRECESDGDKYNICKALGLEQPQPSWYKQAVAEGWTPPKGLVVK